MKIVFLDRSTLGEIPGLDAEFAALGEYRSFEITSASDTVTNIGDADVVITNKVMINEAIMQQCKNIKLICVAATGMNNVDLDYAAKNNITVKNVKGYSAYSVAQVTFSMILHFYTNIPKYDQYVKSKSYSSSPIFTNLTWPVQELEGQRLGIIGLGDIGHRVAEMAKVFGMDVKYYSTSGKNISLTYPMVSLKELMSESDVITIHAPLNDATRNLIDYEKISWMQSHALLLNSGRGGIVVEADLAKAIDEGLIQGAGLDVYAKEPLPADSPLLSVKNKERLILLPHIAWTGLASRRKLADGIVYNIKKFIS